MRYHNGIEILKQISSIERRIQELESLIDDIKIPINVDHILSQLIEDKVKSSIKNS